MENLALFNANCSDAEIQKLVGEHVSSPEQDSSSNKIIELKEITNGDR